MAEEDKAALLGAIAAGGTRAKQAYEDAQKALQSQQADAIKAALAGSVAASIPAEAQAQLSATISQPYQNRVAALTQNSAGAQDYFNRIGTANSAFMDQVAALGPALRQQYEQELALKMANSGGGGGGGGGADKSDYEVLAKALGGKENLQDYFRGKAQNAGDPYLALKFAIDAGIDPNLARSWFPYGSANEQYQKEGEDALTKYLAGNLVVNKQPVRNVRQFRTLARQQAQMLPGDQSQLRRQLVQQAKRASRKKK